MFVFVVYVSCLSCFLVCSLQPCGRLTSWPSCMWCVLVLLSLSHVVSWVRCGTWLYRFLSFAFLLALKTVFILANDADPWHFIKGLCLPNYMLTGIQKCKFALYMHASYVDAYVLEWAFGIFSRLCFDKILRGCVRFCKCSIFCVITLITLRPDISYLEIGVDPDQLADSQLIRIHIVFNFASILRKTIEGY